MPPPLKCSCSQPRPLFQQGLCRAGTSTGHSEVWGQHRGTAGQASSCSTGIPYACWFTSSRDPALVMARESSGRWSRCLGSCTHTGD